MRARNTVLLATLLFCNPALNCLDGVVRDLRSRENSSKRSAAHLSLPRPRITTMPCGDILHDIEAAHRAGCRAILIANGHETEWDLKSPGRR